MRCGHAFFIFCFIFCVIFLFSFARVWEIVTPVEALRIWMILCPYGVVISFANLLFSALELQQGLPSVMDRISLLVRVQMESDLAADGVAVGSC